MDKITHILLTLWTQIRLLQVYPDQDDSLILKKVHGHWTPILTKPNLSLRCNTQCSAEFCTWKVQWTRTQTGYYISKTPVFNHMTLGESFAQSGLRLSGEGAGLERN